MIRRVSLRHFKRFREEVFELSDRVVLAGPNDSGKTTLLQAIAAWKFGLDRWRRQRSGGRGRMRSGVPITRDSFTPVPVREMNLLWEGRLVTRGPSGRPRRIEIELQGDGIAGPWACGVEFQYANPDLLYVRPLGMKTMTAVELGVFPPPPAARLRVVFAPSLSGVLPDEPRRERGFQDLLIGSGRAGEVLRNLLYELSGNREDWDSLRGLVEELFGVELLAPAFSPADPYITCEYRQPGIRRTLDLASAGSGLLQVLLLFACFFARRGTVILADEPDAHQHGALRKRIHEELRRVAAERKGQLIAATHSPTLLDATDPADVVGLFPGGPRTLVRRQGIGTLGEGRRLSSTELLRTEERRGILYLEGRGDEAVLGAWARVLEHPAAAFFRTPNIHWLRGEGLAEAASHFRSLRRAFPDLAGLCLLGGGRRSAGGEAGPEGLAVARWRRAAIPNYLVHPEAIVRFVRATLPTRIALARKLRERFPADADPLGDIPELAGAGAGEELLLPLLEGAGRPTRSSELHQLAAVMQPAEIHPEAVRKLDRIAALLPPSGSSPPDS